MDLSTISIWCWLIPLVVGVLCAYLGYLMGKGGKAPEVDTSKIQQLEKENKKLAADLAICREQTGVSLDSGSDAGPVSNLGDSATAAHTSTEPNLSATEEASFDATAAKIALGKNIKLNDLKLIEGIGPKIENLFQNQEINTWLKLADLSVAQCREILMTGGPRYRLHDPASWPMQARMAAEGKWKDLARWQDDHKHGRL